MELLITVDRTAAEPLHAQVERGLREAIRAERLTAGTRLPSSRELARELAVSRGVVVEAYAQLSAEGWIAGLGAAGTRVAATAGRGTSRANPTGPATGGPAARGDAARRDAIGGQARRGAAPPGEAAATPASAGFDFHPGTPDLVGFPAAAWLRSLRAGLSGSPSRLAYGDFLGDPALRAALVAYLGRSRGVVAEPDGVLVTCGFTHGLGLLCRALRAEGARRVAIEDPGWLAHRMVVAAEGLEAVPVPVDEHGLDAGALPEADAVILTPAHQMPTGVVLTPRRRNEILAWAERHDALIVEDDYDAEYRYDREPVGTLQARAPDRVVHAGSTSKILAPALRLGWLVVPERLRAPLGHASALSGLCPSGPEQAALADFVVRGELDRHLRRMRPRYRARRNALRAALARDLPASRVEGAAGGLHLLATLPAGTDERAITHAGTELGMQLHGMAMMRADPDPSPPAAPGLVLGYANATEAAIAERVTELAKLVTAVG